MNEESTFWYARVAASPHAESGEAVNVALIIGSPGRQTVEFYADLPRLKCLVTNSEMRVYKQMIRSLSKRVESGGDIKMLRQTFGPQLQISDPHLLYVEPRAKIVTSLRRAFLASPSAKGTRVSVPSYGKQTESRLDRLIQPSRLPLGVEFEKSVRPEKLFEKVPDDLEGAPTIARAVRFRSRELLLDSVIITPGTVGSAIKRATVQIGRAFWYYQRSMKEIKEISGREVTLLGVIFLDGARGNGNGKEVEETSDFIADFWRKEEARVAVQSDSFRPPEVQQAIDWVAE